jgi:hypothetical protein
MSQFYPQSGYPPEQPHEDYYEDYSYEEDEFGDEAAGGPGQKILLIAGIGCLIFACIACFCLLVVFIWSQNPGADVLNTPVPGSNVGLSPDNPARPDAAVVNEEGLRLSLRDVNRNAAALSGIPAAEGREIIIITVQLENLNEPPSDIEYSDRSFSLLNLADEVYIRKPDAIDGALGRGFLASGEGTQGRLVFEVLDGERDLILIWESPESTARYISLE